MKHEGSRSTGIGVLLTCCALAACDVGPTEPPALDPTIAAAEFIRFAVPAEPGEGMVEAKCPAGGIVGSDISFTMEQDGDITIRRMELVRHYEDCGMQRGTSVIIANGEMTMTGETHLEHDDAQWPYGVLFQKTHQVGTLTMSYDGGETHTCEYDLESIFEPAVGRIVHTGTVCGVHVDSEGHHSGSTYRRWRVIPGGWS